jgi:hypothetical protein
MVDVFLLVVELVLKVVVLDVSQVVVYTVFVEN